jgi:hypothetical protein
MEGEYSMTIYNVNECLYLAQSEAILADKLAKIQVELFLEELAELDKAHETPFGLRTGEGFDTYQYVKLGA